MSSNKLTAVVGSILLALALSGCSGNADRCAADDECDGSQICFEGECRVSDWTASVDAGGEISEEDPDRAPAISVPERLSIEARAGTETSEVLAIRNVGNAPLHVSEISGDSPDAFSVTYPTGDPGPAEEDREEGLPMTIPGGEEALVRVWFRPNRPTEYSGSLEIRSDDPNNPVASVDLHGSAYDDPPPAACLKPAEAQRIDFGTVGVGELVEEKVEVENCASSPVTISDARAEPTPPFEADLTEQATLEPGSTATVEVRFEPGESTSYSGHLFVSVESQRVPEVEIPIEARARDCPTPIARASVEGRSSFVEDQLEAAPVKTVFLDASESFDPDGTIEEIRWSVSNRPTDSISQVQPAGEGQGHTFFLDRVGNYVIELEVIDDDGNVSCERDTLEIEVRPESDLYYELTWETPMDDDPTDDSGADLDLHYLHSYAERWNEKPWDIYWNNQTADWGKRDIESDDPKMLREETAGAGPEAIAHDDPVSGTSYVVGVYYYDDHGIGASFATVRIYVERELKRAFTDKELEEPAWFWKVAEIEWPSKNVYERNEISKDGFPKVQ